MPIVIIITVIIIVGFILALTTTAKFFLFNFDKGAIAVTTWYFIHRDFSTKFASGYAVWFWDVVFVLIAVILYSVLFKALYRHVPIIGKPLNFCISMLVAYIVFCLVVNMFLHNTYFLPLLNHKTANLVVNGVIIFILGMIVWSRRTRIL